MHRLIDTHCHLTSPELAPQLDAVLARAGQAGVSRCVTIATGPADADHAIKLMQHHANVYLGAGIHPHGAADCTEDDFTAIERIHRGQGLPADVAQRVVAVGETGLDFFYDFATPQRQEAVFRRQLELACDVNRPVVIHARRAEPQVCDILEDYPQLTGRVVFHCFSGDAVLAGRILDLGFWLSFTGVVTFKNAESIRESARMAPRDRIMVETDSPYMSPEPVRKVRPCEPAFVAHTAGFLADLRGESPEDFAAATTANATRIFGLPIET